MLRRLGHSLANVPDLVYLDFSSDESDDEIDSVDEEQYDPFFASGNFSRLFCR